MSASHVSVPSERLAVVLVLVPYFVHNSAKGKASFAVLALYHFHHCFRAKTKPKTNDGGETKLTQGLRADTAEGK